MALSQKCPYLAPAPRHFGQCYRYDPPATMESSLKVILGDLNAYLLISELKYNENTHIYIYKYTVREGIEVGTIICVSYYNSVSYRGSVIFAGAVISVEGRHFCGGGYSFRWATVSVQSERSHKITQLRSRGPSQQKSHL